MASTDRIISWDEFNAAIMRLNAKEAFAVALAIEPVVSRTANVQWPPRHQPVADLPDLLVNYAYALGDVDNRRRFSPEKVAKTTQLIFSTRFKQANDYAVKLGGRVEFQNQGVLARMPAAVDSMFDLAMSDAQEGSARGFAWSCFCLKQSFAKPTQARLSTEDALDLHEALAHVPDVVVETYGEAGFDVAVQMEKLHGKISAMTMRA